MRLLYLGLPLGAEALRRAGYMPVAACIWHLDAPGLRRLRARAGRAGALVLGQPNLSHPAVVAALASLRPDALLSWFWPRLIPPEVLRLPAHGAFGVHPSLLPRWRGPDPYFWAIRAGDAESGVTLHRLESVYDTGDVIAQHRVAIAPDDDAWSLARKLDRASLSLLVDAAGRLARGETLAGTPQDEAAATWAPRPDEGHLAVRWKAPSDEVLRLVRAAAPLPGAGCRLGDVDVRLLRASRASEPGPRALLPGEAFVSADGALAVRCGDGEAVRLDEVCIEFASDDGNFTERRLRGREIAQLLCR
jgi:methionyl-tRNA formyltransferase